MPEDPPFPGARGVWVARADFVGIKSFGRFECSGSGCDNTWASAHAYKLFKQGCKSCEKKSFPRWMWVNDDTDRTDSESEREVPTRPHDRRRCDACAAGVCTAAGAAFV